MSNRLVRRLASCLFETIDSLVYFEVYPTVMGEDGEVILVNEFLRNITDFYPDILWLIKQCSQVEVGDVEAGKACVGL